MCLSGADDRMKNNPNLYQQMLDADHDKELLETINMGITSQLLQYYQCLISWCCWGFFLKIKLDLYCSVDWTFTCISVASGFESHPGHKLCLLEKTFDAKYVSVHPVVNGYRSQISF